MRVHDSGGLFGRARGSIGVTPRFRAFLVTALLSCLLLCPSWNAHGNRDEGHHDRELETLMAAFASGGNVRAEFSEMRRISLLTRGIKSEGVLYFAPGVAAEDLPDRLLRHTTRPDPARVVVWGERVFFSDATGERSLDLGQNGVARSLLSNLAVLLRGDLAELRRRYRVAFAPESRDQPWRLDLHPMEDALRALVERIEVRGRGTTPHSMETRETNGDSTLVRFTRVKTRLALSPAEAERIFSPGFRDDAALPSSPRSSPPRSSPPRAVVP